MVFSIVHKLEYIIEFKTPIDYFDVFLQKQIDLRLKFVGNESRITIVEFDNSNIKFKESEFNKKYTNSYQDYNLFSRISFLELNNRVDKYTICKKVYDKLLHLKITDNDWKWMPEIFLKDNNIKMVSYDEFEFNVDTMLNELNILCNEYEFTNDEKKIIDAFTNDSNLKSNIKFIGWKDYWITV